MLNNPEKYKEQIQLFSSGFIKITGDAKVDNIIYELYCGHQFHTRCLMNYIPNKNKSSWKHRKDDDTSSLECPTCITFIELDEITTIKSVPENFLDEDKYDVVVSQMEHGLIDIVEVTN